MLAGFTGNLAHYFVKLIAIVFWVSTAQADLAIGTISYSQHFDSKAEKWNESHNGIYVKYNHLAVGRFDNSYGDESRFIAAEFILSEHWSASLGIADGYEATASSRGGGGYLPMAFVTYRSSVIRVNLTSDAVVLGVEF